MRRAFGVVCVIAIVPACGDRQRARPDGHPLGVDGAVDSSGVDGAVDSSIDGAPPDGAPPDGAMGRACASLPLICGPAGTSSCCTSPLVPGGTFYRSYDVGTDGMFPNMSYPATVSDFRLDTYLVTVGRFRQFVEAGMGTQQNPPAVGAGARTLNGMANQGGWDSAWNSSLASDTSALTSALKTFSSSWTDTVGANEGLPMNGITWFEAFAFCAWDSGFLPTEAEWNYASAGGSEQRAYPWSNPPSSIAIDCSYGNYTPYSNGMDTPCVNGSGGSRSAVNVVGSESPKGDGKWTQADLGGNVWEWLLDWYVDPYITPCNGCANLVTGSDRVLRGGANSAYAIYLRTGSRIYDSPSYRDDAIGVRCAKTP